MKPTRGLGGFVQASGFSSSAPRDVCGAVLASVSLPDGGEAHAEGINGALLQVGPAHRAS